MLTSTLLLSNQLPTLQYSSTPERFDETWEAPLAATSLESTSHLTIFLHTRAFR